MFGGDIITRGEEVSDKPRIYSYFEYRDFCRDWYQYHKKSIKGFTYKSFADAAGLKSVNYFQRIVSGKRNLSVKNLEAFSKAMELSDHERRYFALMLEYDLAPDSVTKTRYLNRLMSMRKSKGMFQMKDYQLKYLDKWWYPIVRELVTVLDFKNEYACLAAACIPRISESQARAAVNYLLKHNYVKRNEYGRFVQATPIISTGDEVRSLYVRKFHRENLALSSDLVDCIEPDEREVSSITFSVSKPVYKDIKEEIQRFRKRVLEMINSDSQPAEGVYSASFQLFPRSKNIAFEESGEYHE